MGEKHKISFLVACGVALQYLMMASRETRPYASTRISMTSSSWGLCPSASPFVSLIILRFGAFSLSRFAWYVVRTKMTRCLPHNILVIVAMVPWSIGWCTLVQFAG